MSTDLSQYMEKTCAQCGGAFAGRASRRYCSVRCKAAFAYAQRRGRGGRSVSLLRTCAQTRPVAARNLCRPCVNCERVRRIHAHNRCGACYVYRRAHGTDRPAAGAWSVSRTCRICGRGLHKRQGSRCSACATYRWRYGAERPSRLWASVRT
jgi:hypothetical protein